VGLAVGQDQKADKKLDKALTMAEPEAKQMLLLMDADKSGKVSKQEFMAFMEAEFARLDVNKDGELDVKELTQSNVRIHTASHR
jgi:Ca2+-binding EF-hand superfamily protein